MSVLRFVVMFIRAFFCDRAELAVENLALRQQLAILQLRVNRPRLRQRDRIFWVWLSRAWANWRSVLVIVQPDTVVRWHRQGFKLYWRWKSRSRLLDHYDVEPKIRALRERLFRAKVETAAADTVEISRNTYREYLSLLANSGQQLDDEQLAEIEREFGR